MAQNMADPCRNCGAALSPGAAFCLVCGTTLTNRAATPAPSSVPLSGNGANPFASGTNPFGAPANPSGQGGRSDFPQPGQGQPGQVQPVQGQYGQSHPEQGQYGQGVPGIINVGSTPSGPLVPPVQVGEDPRGAAATALVNAGAGRRLMAKILDGVLPAILMGVGVGVGTAFITATAKNGSTEVNITWLLILTGIASLLSLAFGILMWVWEAKTGKTIGNVVLGLRTTNMEGLPAGLLAIFLRLLMISLSSIVPTVGPIIMLISNTWDKNEKKQGWHDKVAHTLVFNVSKGRNPVETGGIAEREKFVPAGVATLSPVQSPLARPAARPAAAAAPAVAPAPSPAAVAPAPGQFAGVPSSATGVGPDAANQASVPAPALSRRAARRNKKGAQVDPFAPPAIQFQNQPAQAQQQAQQQNQAQQQGSGQQFVNQPFGQQVPGQFQNQQLPNQQGQQFQGQPQGQNQFQGQPFQGQQQGQNQFQNQPQGQQFQAQQQGQNQNQFQNQPGQQANPFAPPPTAQQPEHPIEQGPITTVPGITRPPVAPTPGESFSAPAASPAPAPFGVDSFDLDDAGETRARPQGARVALRLVFDDGRTEELGATALIGRNPAGYDGEMVTRLIPVQDSTRSVSKTHMHLRAAAEGLWVTDRNSTNGSAITTVNGVKTSLTGGTPALAQTGSCVHFGDRYFVVEQA